MQEMIMTRLSKAIIDELDRKKQSCLKFAELCGVGRNIMSDIVNRQKTDVRLSTIVKICENSGIKIENVFCDCRIDKMINNAVISINGRKYRIELKEYNSTPPHATKS